MQDTNKYRRGEIATTLTAGAVILMLVGTLFGVKLAMREQTVNTFAATGVIGTDNSQITATFQTPASDRTWDYILSGTLCFAFTPPTNAKFRVEISSDNELVGTSINQQISVPSQAKCSGRGLTFTTPFNLPSSNSCPNLKVKVVATGGGWPNFQEEIGTINADFFCPNRPTSIPTSGLLTPIPLDTIAPTNQNQPTAARLVPTTRSPISTVVLPRRGVTITGIPVDPVETPRPELRVTGIPIESEPRGASGRISIYSCANPTTVTLRYCDDQNGNVCAALPYSTSGPTNQGIWLDDTSGDRALVYRYEITKKASGETLNESNSVYIQNAEAIISSKTVSSSPESKEQVAYGQTLDLTIFAEEQTCSCTFQSTAYVKNASGDFVRKYDLGLPQFGVANDKQRARLGDNPTAQFVGGQVTGPSTNLNIATSPDSYGRDHIATVKLYHDNSRIEKLTCDSRDGNVPACPGEKWQWEGSASSVTDPKVFPGLRVTCDANIKYGWTIDPSILSIEGLDIPLKKLDLNNDGVINTIDYQGVLDYYAQTGSNLPPDFNSDRAVNAVDLSMIISRIGDSVE